MELLLKLPLEKLELIIVLSSYFHQRFLLIFIHLQLRLPWNTVAMSELVLSVALWICWINYGKRYVKLLVLHFLLLFRPHNFSNWCLSEPAVLVPLAHSSERSNHYSKRLNNFLSPVLDIVSLYSQTLVLFVCRILSFMNDCTSRCPNNFTRAGHE